MNQLATRIGFSSLIPHSLLSLSPTILHEIRSMDGVHDEWSSLMSLSANLTGLVRTSADLLFPSKATTRDLIKTGGYRRILENFKPILEDWWSKYSSLPGIYTSLCQREMHKGSLIANQSIGGYSSKHSEGPTFHRLLLRKMLYILANFAGSCGAKDW
jgi:hypothetical protein